MSSADTTRLSLAVSRIGRSHPAFPTTRGRSCIPAVFRGLVFFGLLVSPIGGGEAAEPVEAESRTTSSASRVIRGHVTGIVDGDTLQLVAGKTTYVVDLAGIDAPEKGQLSGDMAAQVLYLKVFDKQVALLIVPTPSPDPVVQSITPRPASSPPNARSATTLPPLRRVCGIVYLSGCVNSELVREGMAWHDSRGFPSTTLSQAEAAARKGLRGLWGSEQEPTPPWLWRSQQRTTTAMPAPGWPQGHGVQDLSRYFEAPAATAAVEATAQEEATIAVSPVATAPAVAPAGSGDRWLTTSSGVRHNSKCRYYKKSQGRPCGAAEGRPCQRCGG